MKRSPFFRELGLSLAAKRGSLSTRVNRVPQREKGTTYGREYRQLRQRFVEVFGETTRAGNKIWLVKRIAWRMQALAEGDLSERARRRAEELARDADLRLNPPRNKSIAPPPMPEGVAAPMPAAVDARLPPPGTILTRPYKGQLVQVQILTDGFAYGGGVYPSLSAVAKAISGSHCNGFLFFRSSLNHNKENA
jgi:hypothetical protein